MARGADVSGTGEKGRRTDRRRIFAGLTLCVNSLLVFATLLASPAPEAIGAWELAIAVGLLLLAALLARGAWTGSLVIGSRDQLLPLLLVPVFGLPVMLSTILGAVHGVPVAAIVRAALPYVAFLPVILAGFLPGNQARPGLITVPLVAAGTAQAVYLLWLFLVRVPDPSDIGSVWIWRTTLIDPRTTLPLLLATAAIPLAWPALRWPARAGRAVLVALPLAAALSTQTRSQVLAVLATTLAGLTLLVAARLRGAGVSWRRISLRAGTTAGLAFLIALVLLLAVPQTRALLGALVLRTQADVDTGRVSDEWIPALNAVAVDGPVGFVAGIGAGESFITASGEARTYVHNLVLYGLVYFGAPGLACILLGYLLLVGGLARRGLHDGDPRYLTLAVMVGGMFLYAQFFAVHKLFSYNLMLALCGQALAQPRASRAAKA